MVLINLHGEIAASRKNYLTLHNFILKNKQKKPKLFGNKMSISSVVERYFSELLDTEYLFLSIIKPSC